MNAVAIQTANLKKISSIGGRYTHAVLVIFASFVPITYFKNKKSALKDTALSIRLTTAQKQKYADEAKTCNMTLSNYVLHILQNKKVTFIENGAEIANAMYDLNETLNKCINNPKVSAEEVRPAVDNSVSKLKARMEEV